MNGIDFLADTNAILYALEEHPVVRGLLRCLPAISVISEIELLGKKGFKNIPNLDVIILDLHSTNKT